ncbi:MAG: hypothetical protein AAF485_11500 [Chloroflexota bacterium]
MIRPNSVSVTITIAAFIVFIGFSLRVGGIAQTPPGLWYDEAYNAMDALWVGETNHYPPFFVGNNGREPMWHYLLLLSTSLFGPSMFAVRWVGILAGTLTLPIVYRFASLLLAPFVQTRTQRAWLALATMGWVSVSWWHLLNSRASFRSVLLPPLLMLTLYFWLIAIKQLSQPEPGVKRSTLIRSSGITRSGPLLNFILAGVFLGLTQYTYLSARLAPIIFGGLAVVWTLYILLSRKRGWQIQLEFHLRPFWIGLIITATIAAILFLPLGLFFVNNPDSFSARTGDVIFLPDSLGALITHLWQGATFFLGAGHDLYRHHLPGRALLGWLEIPFFWVGLILLCLAKNFRRPETHLLLFGLGIMMVPTLLASPPVHSLRPIGILPFYYLIVTLGLHQAARLRHLRYKQPDSEASDRLMPFALAAVITFNGAVNVFDYFQHWANHPEVYQEFNGPLVDLSDHIIDMTETTDVIIPFHLYVHPTTRYSLNDAFPESNTPPASSNRPVEMLLVPSTFQLLYVGNIPESPALVLLSRDSSNQGSAYVSRPPRAAEQLAINEVLTAIPQLTPFTDKLGRDVAQFASIADLDRWPDPQFPLTNLFDAAPLRTTNLIWDEVAQLIGYDVTPALARSGQPMTLNLYWRSLSNKTFEHRLFLQLIDGQGNPINQWEGDAFREDMYRWRPEGILPTQHTLWLGPDAPAGPYLIRIGFFDEISGERLPLQIGSATTNTSVTEGVQVDQVQLGLFYVSASGSDPHQPAYPSVGNFSDTITLVGATIPEIEPALANELPRLSANASQLTTTFHWKTIQPTETPQTIFLQLLNEQNEVLAGWDSQPFNGLYPTHLWSPGESIANTITLPLPTDGLSPGTYRLITGLYNFDTGQRLPVVTGDDFTEFLTFTVE